MNEGPWEARQGQPRFCHPEQPLPCCPSAGPWSSKPCQGIGKMGGQCPSSHSMVWAQGRVQGLGRHQGVDPRRAQSCGGQGAWLGAQSPPEGVTEPSLSTSGQRRQLRATSNGQGAARPPLPGAALPTCLTGGLRMAPGERNDVTHAGGPHPHEPWLLIHDDQNTWKPQ